MLSMKTKKKRPTAVIFAKNMKTAMTLSDRLKIAGIRELKPQCEGKQSRNLTKSSKKRKNYKAAAEKHRNLIAQICSEDSNNNKAFKSKKIPSENSSNFSSDSNDKNKSAEEAINVSLDFIKDCRKYKRKVRNPKDDFQLSNQRAYTISTKPSLLKSSVSRMSEEKENKNNNGNECCFLNENKTGKLNRKKKIDDELKCFAEDLTKTYYAEFLINKQSSCDVAKIDKKYLDSVLSLASHQKPSKKKDTGKGETEKGRTKQMTGKNYCNTEAKNKDQGAKNSEQENKINFTGNLQNGVKRVRQNQLSARIVRDSTKSEVQFQLRYKKAIGNHRNSEELKTEKEVAQSKSELKKRKHRNKILKSINKELIEIPFSSEVSQAKDVKEIWRRETKKKSENSLTSNSSSTIPETDESPKWKNFGLQSYRILHKLVEEEINKICKKSENKNNTKDVKNKENNTQKVHESNPERVKVSLKSKNIINKLKLPKNEHPVNEKETLYMKKKFLHSENLHAEGEKNKNQLLSILNEDSVLIPTGELKPSKVKKTKGSKFPDQAIDNWSILNRLEQAFLALGSSNFKDDLTSKTNQPPKKNSTQNCEFSGKDSNETEEQEIVKSKTKATNDTLNRKNPDTEFKKIQEPKVRSRLNNNEWIFPRRKNEDAKLPAYTQHSAHSKEKCKRNEPKSLNFLDQGEIKELPLRKRTCCDNTLRNFSTQPKISNTSTKTNSSLKSDKMNKRVKGQRLGAKEEPKNRGKDIVKKKSLSCNQTFEKREDKTKPLVSKNTVKPPAENIYGSLKSGIPKLRLGQKMKSERTDPVEERLKNHMSEKRETNQRILIERPVKERSILSVHGKQKENQPSSEKYNTIQENTTSNFTAALKSNTGDLITKRAQRNFEDLYRKSTLHLQENKSKSSFIQAGLYFNHNFESGTQPDSRNKSTSSSKQSVSHDSRSRINSMTNVSQTKIFQNYPVQNEKLQGLDQSKTFLWEKDIRRYREIVNDIMSQYKRIDGFLKHSERLGSPSNNIDSNLSSQKSFSNEKPGKFFNKSQDINLQEYRKKIISEYQTLPFFEYKQLDKHANFHFQEPRKRNLSVVSNINREMDFDVKDYQPKVTKVLDSQLYVDKEDLNKRNSENKPKHKKLSLQEILLCRDRDVFQQHCLKTHSLPKTMLLPGGEVSSVPFKDQKQTF